MIQDKKERCIAKIISINAYKLEAELLAHINSFNINGFDEIYQFIRLNGYVLVCIENDFIVASITSIREKDFNTLADRDGLNKIKLNKINTSKVLDLFPLGVLEKDQFTFGVSNYPSLYSDVLYIKEKELNRLFSSQSNESNKSNKSNRSLEIGTWTLMDKYKVKIDIDEFFGFHSAILGNTGSGKSCTISAILQSIYKTKKYPGSKFIFFDVNNEYTKAFTKGEQGRNKGEKNFSPMKLPCSSLETPIDNIKFKHFDFENPKNKNQNQEESCKFYLPLKLLNIDEWELLLKASSKAQAPILRNALYLSGKDKNIKRRIIALSIENTYLSSEGAVTKYQRIQGLKSQLGKKYKNIDAGYHSKYGSFSREKEKKFLEKLNDLIGDKKELFEEFNNPKNGIKIDSINELIDYIDCAIIWEEGNGNNQARDHCSPLITRLQSLSKRKEFDFFKKEETTQETSDLESYVNNLIADQNITIINFNHIDDEVIEVVSSILSRILFEYLKGQKSRNKKPIHLVLDEAHRYISNNKGKEYFFEANRIFERIAKEARKYGLFLILSSQRPSELNETVLSQCSNFIIHRIQNPKDLEYIELMTPYISKAIIRQLPSIPRQQGLIFGTATNLPVLFKVKDAYPTPDSQNNKIVENWAKSLSKRSD